MRSHDFRDWKVFTHGARKASYLSMCPCLTKSLIRGVMYIIPVDIKLHGRIYISTCQAKGIYMYTCICMHTVYTSCTTPLVLMSSRVCVSRPVTKAQVM